MGRAPGSGAWWRAPALLVLVATLVSAGAAPAFAASGSSMTATDGGTTTTTTRPTTSTTKPSKPHGTTTTTTTPPPPPAPPAPAAATPPGTVPPDQVIPTAGPPDLAARGILLPGDSLAAATAELAIVRAELDKLQLRQQNLAAEVAQDAAKLDALRSRHERESEQRLDRAVATYQGHASGWQLSVLTGGKLADERAVYLVDIADAATRDRLRKLARDVTRTDKALDAARTQKAAVDTQVPAVALRVQLLTAKIADAAGVLGMVTPPGAVAAANSKIAMLADAAVIALNQALLAGRPLPAEQPWLVARHALADALADAGGTGVKKDVVAAIEAQWDLTSPSVLRVVLFALRQVGKPYIYATDGPDTFDCSGLTKRAYAEIGIGLPHFSGAQLRLGIPVVPTDLRPGDLLTYGPDGAEHVTMYVGAGIDVEARGRAYGVVVTGVRLDPAKGFAGAVRFVP